ncbi:MucR family transcriptional regulator [Methylobacterium sp. ID0610]|uniref:MucR family transcriptional regulator n=1 Tax=Methylobacterium carpenticola TaxID=3344827 RepID=UPI0036AA230B
MNDFEVGIPEPKVQIIELVARIVSAYVANNSTPHDGLPNLIAMVNRALSELGKSSPSVVEETAKATSAQIKKSITPDYLISFIDGKMYKSMKRHLTKNGLTPDEYRRKYGLPVDYPMVAPNYAAQRSELAKSLGLGQLRRKATEASTPAEPKKGRGRPK